MSAETSLPAGVAPRSASSRSDRPEAPGSLAGAARLVSHAISILSLLTITAGCARAGDRPAALIGPRVQGNLIGSQDLLVRGLDYQGETWLAFIWSGGAYAPTSDNATSTRGTILSHPHYRTSVQEAADIAANIRAWLGQQHNTTVWSSSTGGGIGLSLSGNDGVTWGPEYEPVVVASLMYWLVAGERGELHGQMYTPLPVSQVEALATAIETWVANPGPTAEPIYSLKVQ